MDVLVLGGTGFLGPAVVRDAVARGHRVTVFNRGQSIAELPAGVERLVGDRYTDLTALERAAAGGRTWDAAVDTYTFVPRTVTDAMDALAGAVERYVVVSTVSVYAEPVRAGTHEDSPLIRIPDAAAAKITQRTEVGRWYGGMKARVERAAEERLPGGVTIVRPGLICGEGDTTGRYTYWAMRAREGGRMIGPGAGDDVVQYVDVRDVAAFIVTCVERRLTGAYTVDSPAGERTARSMLDAAIAASVEGGGPGAAVEWVASAFLTGQGVRPWQDMPAWISNGARPGHGRFSVEKALAAGLTIRPEIDTARSALAWVDQRARQAEAAEGEEAAKAFVAGVRGGLDPERERAVLAAWDAR